MLRFASLGILFKSFMRVIWIVGLLFMTATLGFAQGLPLQLSSTEDLSRIKKYWDQLPAEVPDSNSGQVQLQSWLGQIRSAGFLEASIDQLNVVDSVLQGDFYLGPLYEWLSVDFSNIPADILDALRIKPVQYQGEEVSLIAFQNLQDQILTYAARHGFPFARVDYQVLLLEPNTLKAVLGFHPGPLISFDSILVEGNVELGQNFLRRYLGLQKGMAYDQEQLDQIGSQLQNLPFVANAQVKQIFFENNKARPEIEITGRPASRFDFIIGVLPNSQSSGNLLITGDVEAELRNAFGGGERLYAHFEQLRPVTQELELAVNFPYLLNSPFGVEVDFQLYKRDSAFLDLDVNLGLQYLLDGGNYLKVFWANKKSSLLDIDAMAIQASQRLPNNLDVQQRLFGLSFFYQKLDYLFNPRRGWTFKMEAATGRRRILPNVEIDALDLNLYTEVQEPSTQYKILWNGAYFLPVGKRSVLQLASRGGFLLSEQGIYQNEQFRVGGNRLLRGFDEEQFFATHYIVGTLEYRFLLSQNAFLFSFFDQGWIEDRIPERSRVLYPNGFGAGLSLETSAGLFSLSLAYGNEGMQPIDLQRPKVHFGYVSLF